MVYKTLNCGLDIHDGSIGISHSGGADSSVLLYLLFKFSPGPIHIYTCASKMKNFVSPTVSSRVIEYLIRMFRRTDIYHHTFYVAEQNFDTLFTQLADFISQHNLSVLYTAGTALSPDEDLVKFLNPAPLYEKRNSNVTRPVYDKSGKFYAPWWNKDKKYVKAIYEEYGLIDSLFPLTRSCEDLNLLDGHCGKCWWCEERFWAFGRL